MVKEVITDPLGEKIELDTEKIGYKKKSMCHECKKDWKTCENEEIKVTKEGKIIVFGPPTDDYGFPILMYCFAFDEKKE